MGGIYITDRNVRDFTDKGDAAGLDRYLSGKPQGHINACYGYLGGMYHMCVPIRTCLTYAAMENKASCARVMMNHGACFDEVKHPLYKQAKNPVSEAAAPEIRRMLLAELLLRALRGQRYVSGANSFYLPVRQGVGEAPALMPGAKSKGASRFMPESLARALAMEDTVTAGRILEAAAVPRCGGFQFKGGET
ncbi:MAG TPA: hypothetical protein P5511_09335 [Candidatus Goldiibacteriota bacterium]|nr:hypothetical protein [Candidatus Goldiibacteriota bacterium]